MINKILDHIFPITGGLLGAVGIGSKTMLLETTKYFSFKSFLLETIALAVIGGIVGYITKKLMDLVWGGVKKIFKK